MPILFLRLRDQGQGRYKVTYENFWTLHFRKCNRSEVETLLVGRVWWEVDVLPIVDLGCHKETA